MLKQNIQPGAPEKEHISDIEMAPENQEDGPLGTEENHKGNKPETQSATQSAEQFTEQSIEERIIELESLLAEAEDRYLRKAADFENFRKRMNREKQEAIEFANQSLLLDLIQIMDDFERALIAGESIETKEFSAFYEGIVMIEKRLSSQLENKWGLKRYNSAGETFDPNFHEAVQMERSTEVREAVVQEEFYKGYTLKERVVRSAKVKVLMPENLEETQEAESKEGEEQH